jgi:integrase
VPATVSQPATAKRHERVERGIYKRQVADGVRYEFCFQDERGKVRWGTVRTLKEAREGRAAKIAAVARGEKVAPTKVTFAELAETWYEQKQARLRGRTRDYYRAGLDLVLLPRFGQARLTLIDADMIVTLIRDLEREGLHALDPDRKARPLGRSSITNYLKPLQSILALAVRRRLIPANPFDLLTDDDRPVPSEPRPMHEWSDADVAALLEASAARAKRDIAKYDYTALLRVTAALGLRLGEVVGLCWEDFDKEGGYLHVRRQWLATGVYGPTKTKAGERQIALPTGLRDELIALRTQSRYSQDDQPIFASQTGRPLGHRNVTRRGFEPARDDAKLPGFVVFHDLRHAAASRLIGAGLDPVTVASVLGHEDATVTLRIYGHLYNRARTDRAVRAALAG